MSVSFRQLHAAFAAEVAGIDCRWPSVRRGRRDRGRHGPLCRAGVPRPEHHRRTATRLHPALRRTGELRERRSHPQAPRLPAWAGHGGFLQSRQGRQDHVGRGPGLVLQAWRPAVALGQFVPPGAGEVFAAVRADSAVMGCQHRIRRHARRLRCTRRAHQGRGRGSGLRAFADLLARGDRFHRSDRAGDRATSARCASAWCARIR